MEFWGVEVKAGEPLKVKPEIDSVIHLSQAALGETKKDKGNDAVMLFVKVGDQKIVLGTLSSEKFPQISFDVVLEKEFELSHNWKNGSVYFCGYQSPMPVEEDEEGMFGSSDEDEEIPVLDADNGKIEAKVSKESAVPVKSKGKIAEPVKVAQESKDSDDDEENSEDEDSDDSDGPEDMSEDSEGDEEDDDEASDDSEDEETPKKVEVGKKRSKEISAKTPAETKKAKLVTPQKTDGKKAARTATPHPAKIPAPTKQQTPKSGSQFSCKSCERNFNSDIALQSHTKAKHGK